MSLEIFVLYFVVALKRAGLYLNICTKIIELVVKVGKG